MDLSRHLPLSNRPRDDESGVTSDERPTIALLVERAAAVVDGQADADGLAQRFASDAGLGALASVGDLRTLAEAVRTGRRRRGRHLVDAARALLRLADTAGADAAIPPAVLGRVSLHASATASFDRRAALSGSTVRASDAEWEFGRGPIVEGTALEITRFLLGLSDTAPKAPRRQPPDVSAPMSPDATM